jgi:hypothetical protein
MNQRDLLKLMCAILVADRLGTFKNPNWRENLLYAMEAAHEISKAVDDE